MGDSSADNKASELQTNIKVLILRNNENLSHKPDKDSGSCTWTAGDVVRAGGEQEARDRCNTPPRRQAEIRA